MKSTTSILPPAGRASFADASNARSAEAMVADLEKRLKLATEQAMALANRIHFMPDDQARQVEALLHTLRGGR
jgi:hypothetical protein